MALEIQPLSLSLSLPPQSGHDQARSAADCSGHALLTGIQDGRNPRLQNRPLLQVSPLSLHQPLIIKIFEKTHSIHLKIY